MLPSLRSQSRDRVLELRDLGHQRFAPRLVLVLLRRADLLRGRVAPRLRLFGLQDRGAPLLIERDQLRDRPAARAASARVERLGVFANPFDVVHGGLVGGIGSLYRFRRSGTALARRVRRPTPQPAPRSAAAFAAASVAAFFSTKRTEQIEPSYRIISGSASESWLITSGGVRTAAITNAPTMK